MMNEGCCGGAKFCVSTIIVSFKKKIIEQCFDIKKNVFLQRQNPPSLSTMLKCAGRFFIVENKNACCHHARVWNKKNTILPMLPNRLAYPWIVLPTDPLRTYFDLCIIKYFINIISPYNDMTGKLKTFLSDFPDVDLAAIGFPHGWESEPLWVASPD
jgi:hypothetical protein